MKRLIVIALAIVCGMAYSKSLAQTSSALSLYYELMKLEEEKAQLEKAKTEQEKALSDSVQQAAEEKVTFPCQDAVQNDDDYYYAWGKGKSKDQGMAIQSAFRRAQNSLFRQIGEEYVELNETEHVCQMIQRDENGFFIAYVTIRMSKNK